MPQLVKGGKWVFGWVIGGPRRELTIPPAAWDEYQFQVGDEVTFIPGSRRSGGFAVSHPRLLTRAVAPLQIRAIARSSIKEKGRVSVPVEVKVQVGDQLLAVRGSGLALGFVAQGPIYQEAMAHAELETFV